MRSSLVLLVATMAGSSLAMPWNVDIKPTGSTIAKPPTPSGSGSQSPKPPTTSVAPNPPSSHAPNSTSSYTPGTTESYPSTTETITRTIFIPTSTPIALPGGTTKYSTWLTSQTYVTTTCYPITTADSTPTSKPTSTPVPLPLAGTDCPVPSAVTVTVTSVPAGSGVYYTPGAAPHGCDKCQTVTYTNTWGSIETIIIPAPTSQSSPPASETETLSNTQTSVKPTKTPTPPYGTGKPFPPPSGSQGYHPTGGYAKPSGK